VKGYSVKGVHDVNIMVHHHDLIVPRARLGSRNMTCASTAPKEDKYNCIRHLHQSVLQPLFKIVGMKPTANVVSTIIQPDNFSIIRHAFPAKLVLTLDTCRQSL